MYWSKECLDALCYVCAGGSTYHWTAAWAPNKRPHLFGILVCLCFSFTSHPHKRGRRPISQSSSPPPFLLLLSNVNEGWMAAAGPSKGRPCRRVLAIEIQRGHPAATLPHGFTANFKPNIKWPEESNASAPLGGFTTCCCMGATILPFPSRPKF